MEASTASQASKFWLGEPACTWPSMAPKQKVRERPPLPDAVDVLILGVLHASFFLPLAGDGW